MWPPVIARDAAVSGRNWTAAWLPQLPTSACQNFGQFLNAHPPFGIREFFLVLGRGDFVNRGKRRQKYYT
jgi:hypothetical protein